MLCCQVRWARESHRKPAGIRNFLTPTSESQLPRCKAGWATMP
ncbi:hypothetical protein A2U01_0073653, partial [Trifolium medium]|nr:hypothetical protein [Trifolium medium]